HTVIGHEKEARARDYELFGRTPADARLYVVQQFRAGFGAVADPQFAAVDVVGCLEVVERVHGDEMPRAVAAYPANVLDHGRAVRTAVDPPILASGQAVASGEQAGTV